MAACITSGRAPHRTPAIAISTLRSPLTAQPALVLLAGVLMTACEATSSMDSAVASIEITPASLSMVMGAARPLTARVLDASGVPVGDARVFWSSKHPAIAMVTPDGIVTGVSPGNTQVAASVNGTSAVVPVAVSRLPVSLVRVSPASANIMVGASLTLSAQALDATGGVVPGLATSWRSSNASIASVNAAGVVTGLAPGSATLTATVAGLNGVAAVSVSLKPVASVTLSPSTASVSVGKTVQLSATLRDAGGATLTGRAVAWSTSSSKLATVSSTGLVTGHAKGTATITATSEGKSGTATITIR
jgi:uncharacterized protein YjdB